MKLIALLFSLLPLILFSVPVQGQMNSRDLSFTVSSERIDPEKDRFLIRLRIDLSQALGDVLVRVGGASREAILTQVVKQEMFEGSKELPNFIHKECAIRSAVLQGGWVEMRLDSFGPGEYEVFVRVRTEEQGVHMGKKDVIIP